MPKTAFWAVTFGLVSVLLEDFHAADASDFQTEARQFIDRNCSTTAEYDCTIHDVGPDSCHTAHSQGVMGPNKPIGFHYNKHVLTNTQAVNQTSPQTYDSELTFHWDAPHDASRDLLSGFEVDILPEGGQSRCLHLDVSTINWTSVPSQKKLSFKLRMVNVLNYSPIVKRYEIAVQSLPKVAGHLNYVTQRINAPTDPALTARVLCVACWTQEEKCCVGIQNEELKHYFADEVVDCKTSAHHLAHMWTAAFRRVATHAYAKTLTLEFLAAPKELCFEQYEIRLTTTESPYNVLQYGVISRDKLYKESFGDLQPEFGTHTFENLKYGESYIVSLLPISRAADGRCLCPPYFWRGDDDQLKDHKLQCFCTAATWKNVTFYPPVLTPTSRNVGDQNNALVNVNDFAVVDSRSSSGVPHRGWHRTFTLLFTILFACVCMAACLMFGARVVRVWHKEEQVVHIRFVSDENGSETAQLADASVAAAVSALVHEAGTVSIVYAHDSREHDECVSQLAALIRKECNCEVILDIQSVHDIVKNKADWAYKTIQQSDRVIIVHSTGTFYRYQVKLSGSGVLQRRDRTVAQHGYLDDLFLMQLEHVNHLLYNSNRRKLLSVSFDYTPDVYQLKHLTVDNCYNLPRHVAELCHAISGRPVTQAPVDATKLLQRVADVERLMSTRQWFENSHVRVDQLVEALPEEDEEACPSPNLHGPAPSSSRSEAEVIVVEDWKRQPLEINVDDGHSNASSVEKADSGVCTADGSHGDVRCETGVADEFWEKPDPQMNSLVGQECEKLLATQSNLDTECELNPACENEVQKHNQSAMAEDSGVLMSDREPMLVH